MNQPTPTHTVEESMIWRNGRNNGIREERERIIKLLRELQTERSPMVTLPYAIEKAILLIKGENTDKSTVHTSADNAITNTQGENK
jgi:hypothetical protein